MATKRSLIWRIVRLSCWVAAALVAIYLVLLIRFTTGKPTALVNYTTVMNKAAQDASPDDCAWPIYRKALVGFDFAGEPMDDGDNPLIDETPNDEQWAKLVTWLQKHREELELLRRGSSMPHLGFVLGQNGDANDAQVFPGAGGYFHQSAEENPPVITILLPHLQPLREAAAALAADSRLARQQNDRPRNLADLAALMGMGGQLQGDFLVGDLVAISLRGRALNEIARTLTEPNLTLSDSDLQSLAALIAKPDRADGLISYRGERLFCYDMIQRMYTDDGNGDGRLTAEGLRFMQEIGVMMQPRKFDATLLFGLGAPLLASSRRQVTADYDRLMDLADANLRVPYRQATWTSYCDTAMQMNASTLARLRSLPIGVVLPSLERSNEAAERWLAQREGLLIAIALERYRIRHGEYPASLDALVPEYLVEVPVDRIDGSPLHYRLAGTKPLIYSIGADRDDDGGRPAVDASGSVNNLGAAEWSKRRASFPDGDWILFPQP